MSSYQTPFIPSPELLIRDQMRATSYDINCHRVGKIVNFNPSSMTCDVQILELKPKIFDGVARFPQLNDLPLVINGANDSWITFGNIVGSECLIHFNDRDIDNWFETGEEYEPNSNRLHNLSDGFVTLSPRSMPNVINYDTENMHIHNGSCDIIISNNSIQITNGTCNLLMSGDTITITGKVVVSDTVTASDCLSDTISGKTHTHGGVTTGSGSTGVPQ